MGISSWIAWLIVIALAIALVRPHNTCQLKDIPTGELMDMARDMLDKAEGNSYLEGMTVREISWHINNKSSSVERYVELYRISKRLK